MPKYLLIVTISLFGVLLPVAKYNYAYGDEAPNIYDMIADKAKNTSASGTFSIPAMNKLPPGQRNCLFMCATAFAAPEPQERKQEESQTCFSACYAKQLTSGDPEKEKNQNLAMEHYSKAKDLGSQLPPPTFDQ